MDQPISSRFFVQKPHTHFSSQNALLHDFTNANFSNNRTLVKENDERTDTNEPREGRDHARRSRARWSASTPGRPQSQPPCTPPASRPGANAEERVCEAAAGKPLAGPSSSLSTFPWPWCTRPGWRREVLAALCMGLLPNAVYDTLAAFVLVENLAEEGEKRVGLREDPLPRVDSGRIGLQQGVR